MPAAKRAKKATRAKKSTKAANPAATKRILLVDDDAEIIESMRTILEAKGYSVLVARDGSQGIAVAERENPDLVILDMMMPTTSLLSYPSVGTLLPTSLPGRRGVSVTSVRSSTSSRLCFMSGRIHRRWC